MYRWDRCLLANDVVTTDSQKKQAPYWRREGLAPEGADVPQGWRDGDSSELVRPPARVCTELGAGHDVVLGCVDEFDQAKAGSEADD